MATCVDPPVNAAISKDDAARDHSVPGIHHQGTQPPPTALLLSLSRLDTAPEHKRPKDPIQRGLLVSRAAPSTT